MHNATRQAIQASIAVIVTLSIADAFSLERGIWATLTAILLVSSTFGESIKKAKERVSMTLVGGLIGTGIVLYLQPVLPEESQVLLATLLFISIGLIVYFLPRSYAWASFFITLFVVFLFSLLTYWNLSLLLVRAYETLIGALVAVVVSGLIFPNRSHVDVQAHYLTMLDQLDGFIDNIFYSVASPNPQYMCQLMDWHHKLYPSWEVLKNKQSFSEFELTFSRSKRQQLQGYQFGFDLLFHYLTNILTLLEKEPSYLCAEFETELAQFQQVIKENTQLLHDLMQGGSIAKQNNDIHSLDAIRLKIRQKIAQLNKDNPFPDYAEVERFYSLIYYLRKVNQLILDLINVAKT
ncbi:FUSC family protein [Shewanella surugensis]|uniref:FUSC family protein n=1 Tax=Shewanella surugensis TaxID=212020 RepID=A0ABT0LAC0_9GAMM|nr:FUSC family protein [Shewanella surugensis]MCL1124627.1 FUSC family protein [Shewanella surugensis]